MGNFRPTSRFLLAVAIVMLTVGRTIGALTATGAATTAYMISRGDDIGFVRFGRAAATGARVFIDYKMTLRKPPDDEQAYRHLLSQCHQRAADRLLEMCCKNGGCFIKVGQHIGSLDYLLPAEYVNTMKVLHDRAPESPLKDIYTVIKDDLGSTVEELFDDFEKKPIGTASLAQVHRAKLKDGQNVAVKVQHKRVRGNSFVDINTMEILVKFAAWLFPEFKFLWLAEETKINLPLELDFEFEGKNAETVAKLFKHFSWLKVPRIYWALTSQRVLTMEFCEGGNADQREYMEKHKIPVETVSDRLSQLYSEMIFEKGFVHCDPHPGNVLVRRTASGGVEISLLDHGLYASLTDRFRLNYANLWISILRADQEDIKKYSEAMNCGELYGLFSSMVAGRAWSSIQGKRLDALNNSNEAAENAEIQAHAASLVPEMVQVLNRVPREMLLVFKTNDCLRGIDSGLKTRFRANAFVNMTKVCTRVVFDEMLRKPQTLFQHVRLRVKRAWSLFLIDVGAFVLRFLSKFDRVTLT